MNKREYYNILYHYFGITIITWCGDDTLYGYSKEIKKSQYYKLVKTYDIEYNFKVEDIKYKILLIGDSLNVK